MSGVMPIRRVQTDILILGSGGAGLFAALHAHQKAPQLKITVAVKGLLGKCGCTRMVQGGYNVAFTIFAIHMMGVSSIMGAINIIATTEGALNEVAARPATAKALSRGLRNISDLLGGKWS